MALATDQFMVCTLMAPSKQEINVYLHPKSTFKNSKYIKVQLQWQNLVILCVFTSMIWSVSIRIWATWNAFLLYWHVICTRARCHVIVLFSKVASQPLDEPTCCDILRSTFTLSSLSFICVWALIKWSCSLFSATPKAGVHENIWREGIRSSPNSGAPVILLPVLLCG